MPLIIEVAVSLKQSRHSKLIEDVVSHRVVFNGSSKNSFGALINEHIDAPLLDRIDM